MVKSQKKQHLKGGIGDSANPNDFDPKQVKMGMKVESEHTSDKEVAMEIVLDHLSEDPHYYTKLKKVEESSIKKITKKQILLEIINEINNWMDEQADEVAGMIPKSKEQPKMKQYGDCETCGGSGLVYDDPEYQEECWTCEGSGFAPAPSNELNGVSKK